MCSSKENNRYSTLLEYISEDLSRDIGHIKVVNTTADMVEIFEDRIGKNFNIPENYWEADELKRFNSSLKYFDFRGFYFDDYIELLVNYNSDYYFEGDYNLLEELYIDSVYIKLDRPSFVFDVVTNKFINDRWYDYNSHYTISLKGVNLDNFEQYLTQALYLFGINNPPLSFDIFPTCDKFVGEYAQDEYLDSLFEFCKIKDEEGISRCSFKNIKYTEAISYYNEGRRLKDREASFYYFYKVIEYFFFICRKEEFKDMVSEYQKNKDIDNLLLFATKIFRLNEIDQLTYLIETNWDLILSSIHDIKLDSIKVGPDPKSFSKELYSYRNRIIHGKSEFNYERKIPNNLGPSEVENYWTCVSEKISDILIQKYCLS